MSKPVVKLLLVDDDMVDVLGIQRGLLRSGVLNPVRVAEDGREALDILRGDNGAAPLKRPYVLVLDLNMPRMSGLELLDELRSDPILKDTVVFVVTTSSDERDKTRAYERNVAGYIVKSDAIDIYMQMAVFLKEYLALVDLPQE